VPVIRRKDRRRPTTRSFVAARAISSDADLLSRTALAKAPRRKFRNWGLFAFSSEKGCRSGALQRERGWLQLELRDRTPG